jgi:hypothetical protein
VVGARADQLVPVVSLQEASTVIANGYLRLDPQEWVRAVENVRRRWAA